ncbi:hypothetical protein JYT51_02410, partial [Candidatus Amoebophilus asiaticus]|nr:hypothetical protein [Candidatus Amoebophilus asiaticus]
GSVILDGTTTQTITNAAGETFYNLTIDKSSGTVQLNDPITVNNNLAINNGTLDDNGNQVTGNTTGTFTLAANTELKLGAATATSFPTNYTNANITLNVSSTVSYNSSASQTISNIPDYGNLTSTSTGSRTLPSGQIVKIAGSFTTGTNSYSISGSTVEYNGSGTQTIVAFNYNSLTSSSTGDRIISSTGNVRIAGVFTKGTNTYTTTGSTVSYNGSGGQTVVDLNYNNLTISGVRGANDVTLSSTGTIGVANTLTFSAFFSGGGYLNSGSTIEFNGSGAQTIPAFNYNNLTSSSTGARTLASSGTVGIAGTFTIGANTYTTTGSTVDYNGSASQTIASLSYNDLILSNGVGLLFGGNVDMTGDLTISGSLDLSGFALNMEGNFTNNGTFIHSNGAVILDNVSTGQTIGGTGAITFYDLTMNNGSTGATLNSSITVANDLTLTDGDIDLNGNTIDLSSTGTIVGETNDKRIKGTSGVITTTRAISAPASLNVGGMGAILTGADVLGSTTIQRSHVAQTGAGNTGIERFYDITPTNNTGLNMTLRFSYLENELNGQTESSFSLYRSTDGGSTWVDRAGTHSAASNYVELSSISAFSRWTVSNASSNPLPIDLLSFTAEYMSYGIKIKWETATEINNDYFTIERSADGIDFEEIRQVAGAGNSSSPIDYSIIDEAPLQGISYYRLKQTDFDGRYEYFPAVSVKWGDVKEFNILSTGPNPVINELKIQYEIPESGVIKFILIDLNSKLLFEENISASKGVNNYIYETSALNSGVYIIYLRVRDGDKVLSFKFIK